MNLKDDRAFAHFADLSVIPGATIYFRCVEFIRFWLRLTV